MTVLYNFKRHHSCALFVERHKWIWLWHSKLYRWSNTCQKSVFNYRLSSLLNCQSLIQLYLTISFISIFFVLTQQPEAVIRFRRKNTNNLTFRFIIIHSPLYCMLLFYIFFNSKICMLKKYFKKHIKLQWG